nr:DUF6809 family protein [uncultured Oscillibacter sp.]
MRKTLEDLYYGNITPCDRQIEPGSDLQRAMEKAEKIEEKLITRLKDEEKPLLLNLINAQDEISSTIAIEKFILGFRLGMRLAIESLDENDGCLTDITEG